MSIPSRLKTNLLLVLHRSLKERSLSLVQAVEIVIAEAALVAAMVAETDQRAVVDLSLVFQEMQTLKEDLLKRGLSKRIHAFVSTN